MIFFKNHVEDILKGVKTQTRRSSYRYQVGKLYAIQLCRTCRGIPDGKIKIIRKWKEENPYELGKEGYPPLISWDDAQAEGGYAPDNYEGLYEKLNPKWRIRWAYEFEFVPTCTQEAKES